IYPFFGAFRSDLRYSVCQCHAETDQCTGYRSTSEILLSFILARKVNGSFDNSMCFFRSAECVNHNHARTYQEIPGSFGRTEQGSHQETFRIPVSVSRKIHKRRETGKRDTDEVNEVIAGKGESEGESS